MIRSKTLSLQGNVHFIALSLLVFTLATINIYFIAFVLWLLKIKPKYIVLGLLIFFLTLRPISPPTTCKIVELGDYNTCKSSTSIRIKGDLDIGDVVFLKGQFTKPTGRSSPFSFDYGKYLLGKNIHYVFNDEGSHVIGNFYSIYSIRQYMKEYISTLTPLPKKYLSALILGDKQYFDKQELNQFSEMGISHMFAISGLHVGFLALLLERIIPKKYIVVIISTYMVIAGFSPSIVRAGSMYILYYSLGRYGFSSLDCLSLVFISSLIYNRYIVYDVGFQLSFLVTFFLLVTTPRNLLEVSIVAQYATLPIIINMYNQINLVTVIINVYLVWVMSNIILPIGFMTLLFRTEEIYTELLIVFERLIIVSSEFNMIIEIANIHPSIIMLYYFFIKKKTVLLLLLIPLFLKPVTSVYFIDVGQGDSTLIVDEKVYLVDTGGKHGSDVTKRNVIPVLRSLGISEVDYLILTHDHYDHVGGYETILDSVNVNNVVISEFADFKTTFDGRIIRVKKGDSIGVIEVLGPDTKKESINNQSLQLKLKLDETFYLMGDSELKQSFGKMDYLKLGHHGSSTSTTYKLVEETKPEAVIISLGRNNYGLPSTEVMNMIKDIKVCRTDMDGTIIYRKGQLFTTEEFSRQILGFR